MGGFENSFEIRRIGEEIALEKIKGIFDEFAYQGDMRRSQQPIEFVMPHQQPKPQVSVLDVSLQTNDFGG